MNTQILITPDKLMIKGTPKQVEILLLKTFEEQPNFKAILMLALKNHLLKTRLNRKK